MQHSILEDSYSTGISNKQHKAKNSRHKTKYKAEAQPMQSAINQHQLATILSKSFESQAQKVEEWHNQDPIDSYVAPQKGQVSLQTLHDSILGQHYMNFKLWHIEDEARRLDVDDSCIASCKRSIDACNQARNDRMEAVDFCLFELLSPMLPRQTMPQARYNTESPGLAIDRLSILALKIYHMREQAERHKASEEHRASCQQKLQVLLEQRADIAKAVLELLEDYIAGHKQHKVYYQFKMYNDPNLNPSLYNNAK